MCINGINVYIHKERERRPGPKGLLSTLKPSPSISLLKRSFKLN